MSSNDINISGLLTNCLDQGFGAIDCICEWIDNSIAANANHINIKLNNNSIYYTDNGSGMDEHELKQYCVMHDRKHATNEKQGRFGIGGKHPLIYFTQLKYKTTTISKKKCDDCIREITIDWADSVKTNVYYQRPHEASRSAENKWKEYIGDQEHGTMHVVPCDIERYNETIFGITTNQITKNWRFSLGRTYHKYIANGGILMFSIDGKEYCVKEYDVLRLDNIPYCNKKHTDLYMYKNTNTSEIRNYCNDYERFKGGKGKKCKDKKMGYIAMSESKKPYLTHIKENKPEEDSDWCFIGSWAYDSVYSCNWREIDKSFIEYIEEKPQNHYDSSDEDSSDDEPDDDENDDSVSTDNDTSISKNMYDNITTIDKYMGGRYFKRNDKIISRENIVVDHKKSNTLHKTIANSRHMLSFSIEMDKYMNIQTNKSKIDTKQIDNNILDSIKYLENVFVVEQKQLDTPPTISIVQDPVPIVQDPVPIVQPSVQVVRAPEVFATECPTTDSSEEYSSDEDEIVPNTHGVSHHQRTTLCKRDALVVLNEISKKYTQTVPESIIQDLIYIICLTNGKGGDFHMKNQLYAGKLQLAQFILMIEYAYNFKYSDHEDVIGGGILVNIHENFVKNENT